MGRLWAGTRDPENHRCRRGTGLAAGWNDSHVYIRDFRRGEEGVGTQLGQDTISMGLYHWVEERGGRWAQESTVPFSGDSHRAAEEENPTAHEVRQEACKLGGR